MNKTKTFTEEETITPMFIDAYTRISALSYVIVSEICLNLPSKVFK